MCSCAEVCFCGCAASEAEQGTAHTHCLSRVSAAALDGLATTTDRVARALVWSRRAEPFMAGQPCLICSIESTTHGTVSEVSGAAAAGSRARSKLQRAEEATWHASDCAPSQAAQQTAFVDARRAKQHRGFRTSETASWIQKQHRGFRNSIVDSELHSVCGAGSDRGRSSCSFRSSHSGKGIGQFIRSTLERTCGIRVHSKTIRPVLGERALWGTLATHRDPPTHSSTQPLSYCMQAHLSRRLAPRDNAAHCGVCEWKLQGRRNQRHAVLATHCLDSPTTSAHFVTSRLIVVVGRATIGRVRASGKDSA
jgi:hypothetical protein